MEEQAWNFHEFSPGSEELSLLPNTVSGFVEFGGGRRDE